MALRVDYHEYLASERWAFTSEAAKRRAGYRCQVCNGTDWPLDAHHRTYERLGSERDEDITVLCRGCHSLFHAHKRGELPDPNNAWLAEVAARYRHFYRAVLCQASVLAFVSDTVIVSFGRDCPDFVFEMVAGTYCGRTLVGAKIPTVPSKIRVAADAEVDEFYRQNPKCLAERERNHVLGAH
jgi:hypothetical protein